MLAIAQNGRINVGRGIAHQRYTPPSHQLIKGKSMSKRILDQKTLNYHVSHGRKVK